MSNIQKTASEGVYRDWVSPRTINTGIAVGLFILTATVTTAAAVGFAYLVSFPFVAGEPASSALVSASFTATQVVANTTIGLFALHRAKQPLVSSPLLELEAELEEEDFADNELENLPKQVLALEEFQHCEEALKESLESLLTCEARLSPTNNQSTYIQLSKDRGLASNIQIAHQMLSDAQKVVHLSPNNLWRSRKLIQAQAKREGVDLDDDRVSIIINRNCLLMERRLAREFYQGSPFVYGKKISKIAEKTKIGNCGEMSYVAFFKALERGTWTPIHIVHIKEGDHMFLVVGIPPHASLDNYKTWENAVVADVWSKQVFPSSEITTKLNDYSNVDWKTGNPMLKPFDPKTQSLEVLFGNLCSLYDLYNAYIKLSLNSKEEDLFIQVVIKLSQFHKEQGLESKLGIANELYQLCVQPEIESLTVIQLLKDQIDHFIELSHTHYKR